MTTWMYVALALVALVVIAAPFVARRQRTRLQAMQADLDRQAALLAAIERLHALLDGDRPYAEIEREARDLLENIRVLDPSGTVGPVIVHYESELAQRRGAGPATGATR